MKINNNIKISFYIDPWPHFVIDNFLNTNDFKLLKSNILKNEKKFNQRADDRLKINYQLLPDKKMLNFFLGSKFKVFINQLTKNNLEIYENSLVQLRLMDNNSPEFPIHTDQQAKRSYVCLYYVSKKWDIKNGGELILQKYKSEKKHTCPNSIKILNPLPNRMVIFLSGKTTWHKVRKVKDWKRYSIISEWLIKS